MTKKDYDLFAFNCICQDLYSKFKFWNGCQWGIIIGLFITINDLYKWLFLGGCWFVAMVVAAIYLRRYGKAVKKLRNTHDNM